MGPAIENPFAVALDATSVFVASDTQHPIFPMRKDGTCAGTVCPETLLATNAASTPRAVATDGANLLTLGDRRRLTSKRR